MRTAEALRMEGELEAALTEVSEACSFMEREKSAPALLFSCTNSLNLELPLRFQPS